MTYAINSDLKAEAQSMQQVYTNTMTELAGENSKIIAMDADLMASIGMGDFSKRFPKQFINSGIQEANMIGVAAGLSVMGFVPFAHTFACFASRRVADQVFVSAAFARANIRIVGSDPGITAAFNGATHMPFEDIGIMRGIPGVTILEPTDSVMLADFVRQLEKKYGVFYLRLSRKNGIKIYEDGSTFEIGKATKLRAGHDVAIIASGICVAEALKAAESLAKKGITAAVLNMHTIKPVDKQAIIEAAETCGAVVTAENHNIINGLGSAVAEVLVESALVPMERVGINDHFGEVGPVDYLMDKFGLSAGAIEVKAIKAVNRKKEAGKGGTYRRAVS